MSGANGRRVSRGRLARLEELAGEFPDLSTALNTLIARLVDLLPIVRGAVYFPCRRSPSWPTANQSSPTYYTAA
jgi:hypothetical protein